MRILYINSFLGRYDFWTGERGRQLVSALQDQGAEITSFPSYGPPSPTSDAKPDAKENTSSLKQLVKEDLPPWLRDLIIESFMVVRGLAKTAVTSARILLNRQKYDCDVILARTFEYEWTPTLVSKILKRPLVLEIHAPLYKERLLRGGKESKFFRSLEGAMWRHADGLWVHTHELKRIVSEDAASSRIEIIPWGVPAPTAVAQQRTLPEDVVNFVFVGSFYGWHGILDLIDAFAKARRQTQNIHLTLVGDGIERARCEVRLQELGLSDSATLTGWLPKHEVSERLLAADVGVAPYAKIENFYFEPVKVLDYMAHGLAIIASDQGQISMMLENEEDALLVEPGNVDALADAIVQLANEEILRRSFGERAKAKAPTWAQTAEAVLELCSGALVHAQTPSDSARLEEPGRSRPSAAVSD